MASGVTRQPSDPRSGEDEVEERASAADLEEVFKRFDSNGDGKISSSELASVMDALGSATAEEEIRRMMEEMDTDRDGYVDFNEFARFHRGGSGGTASAGSTNIDDLREAFHIYDLDNNGLISATELHKVLQKLGETCSVPDCVRMIASLDSDGDGNINFNEFLNMMNATTTTTTTTTDK